jgi:hypothetical protein
VILFVPTFLAAIYVLRRCELTDRIETRVTALHGHVTRDVDLADACGRTGELADLRAPWSRYVLGSRVTRRIIDIEVWERQLVPEDLALFGAARELRGLTLASCDLPNGELSSLPRLPHLRRLTLSGSAITDQTLAALGRFPMLESLDISSATGSPLDREATCRITDDGLAALAVAQHLEVLALCGAPVTGIGMPTAPCLPSLRILVGGGTLWTDEGAARLAGIPSLEELDLEGTEITDRALRDFSKMPRLRSLRIGGTGATGRGFAHLGKTASLEVLYASSLDLGDAAVAQLSRCAGLRKLDLSHTAVSDSGVASLCSLEHLSSLDLSHTAVSDRGLVHLAHFKHLRSLNLAACHLTPQGLVGALPNMKSLDSLNLIGVPYLAQADIAQIKKLLPGCAVSTDEKDSSDGSER